MSLAPVDWSVVIAGRWNPALFVPAKVAKRIFALNEATPVEVFLSIDDILPHRIHNDGLTITATNQALRIEITRCRFDQLSRAAQIAAREIKSLPNTPLTAAGFNIIYRGDSLPDSLANLFSSSLDDGFTRETFEITGRGFRRFLKHESGVLAIFVEHPPETAATIHLNFQSTSTDAKVLADWISQPMDAIKKAVDRVLDKVFGLTPEVDYVSEHISE